MAENLFLKEAANQIKEDLDQYQQLTPETYHFWEFIDDPDYIAKIEEYFDLPLTGNLKDLVKNYLAYDQIQDQIKEYAQEIQEDLDNDGILSPETYDFWKSDSVNPYFFRKVEEYLDLPITQDIDRLVENYLNYQSIQAEINDITLTIKEEIGRYRNVDRSTYNFLMDHPYSLYYIEHIENNLNQPITGDLDQLVENYVVYLTGQTKKFLEYIERKYNNDESITSQDVDDWYSEYMDPYLLISLQNKLDLPPSGNFRHFKRYFENHLLKDQEISKYVSKFMTQILENGDLDDATYDEWISQPFISYYVGHMEEKLYLPITENLNDLITNVREYFLKGNCFDRLDGSKCMEIGLEYDIANIFNRYIEKNITSEDLNFYMEKALKRDAYTAAEILYRAGAKFPKNISRFDAKQVGFLINELGYQPTDSDLLQAVQEENYDVAVELSLSGLNVEKALEWLIKNGKLEGYKILTHDLNIRPSQKHLELSIQYGQDDIYEYIKSLNP